MKKLERCKGDRKAKYFSQLVFPLFQFPLACVAGVIGEGEGERGGREKCSPSPINPATQAKFPLAGARRNE